MPMEDISKVLTCEILRSCW